MLKDDDELQERYTLTVKNRFYAQTIENESATEEYERFIKSGKRSPSTNKRHKETTKKWWQILNKDREVLEEAFDKYQQDPDEAYRELQMENIQHDNQYKLTWKLINEISGRKASTKGQIEGDTKKERTANWFKHFKGLNGNPPIGGQDEDSDQIIEKLNITDWPSMK